MSQKAKHLIRSPTSHVTQRSPSDHTYNSAISEHVGEFIVLSRSSQEIKEKTDVLPNIAKEAIDVKLRCQFCLEHLESNPKIFLDVELKKSFTELTQRMLNTFSEFICNKCLMKFEETVKYRNYLIDNQNLLQTWYKAGDTEDLSEFIKVEQEEESDSLMTSYCFNCNSYLDDNHMCPRNELQAETDNCDKPKEKRVRKVHELLPVMCDECGKEFSKKAYLKTHFQNAHMKNRIEVCQHCGKLCKNLKRLNAHLLYHQPDRKNKCSHCPKVFATPGDLKRHLRVHTKEKPFICHICSRSYTQSSNLKFHMETHDKGGICDLCGSSLTNKHSLRLHVKKCSRLEYRERRIKAVKRSFVSRSINVPKKKELPVYKCFIEGCDRHYCVRSHLGRHIERDHGIKVPRFETTCLECHFVCETVGEHASHVKTHTCKFICEYCKIRFKTDESRQVHVLKKHREGEHRPFICGQSGCGAGFKRAAHLESHRINMHSDERKFECNVCGLKCREKGSLNAHKKIHTKEKPFSCWACTQTCRTSTLLRQHMLHVHKENRIYSCACSERFEQRKEFDLHRRNTKH